MDVDFTLNLDFLVQEPVSFHQFLALKTNQTHETAFFLIRLVGLEDPTNHPICKARKLFIIVDMVVTSQNRK